MSMIVTATGQTMNYVLTMAEKPAAQSDTRTPPSTAQISVDKTA
jgi:hypothetical protein